MGNRWSKQSEKTKKSTEEEKPIEETTENKSEKKEDSAVSESTPTESCTCKDCTCNPCTCDKENKCEKKLNDSQNEKALEEVTKEIENLKVENEKNIEGLGNKLKEVEELGNKLKEVEGNVDGKEVPSVEVQPEAVVEIKAL